MIDQMILYDQALMTWLNTKLPPLTKGRTTQLLIASSPKGFAEVTSGTLVDNRKLTLPRVSVSRIDHVNDPKRFNSYTIRRLGYCDPPDGDIRRRMRSANFPTPVNLTYQVDLHTKFVAEMNRWEQLFFQSFASQYMYLSITPDSIYGTKTYAIFLDGPIADNSDLEPGEGERHIRRTATLRAEARLYDQDYVDNNIVRRLELQWRHADDDSLLDTQFLPPIEVIGTGNGLTTTFAFTLVRIPILEHTIVVETVIGGTTIVALDDGNGVLYGNTAGTVASGTINYTTGAISITFVTAPDSGEDVKVTYFTNVEI